MMVSASVIVPSRGGRDRLPVLLASARAQTTRDFEVIVVLDGDIDSSEEVLAQEHTDFPLRVITFAENRGRSAALNAGFHAAQGEVLIRADDDLEFEPTFVETHLAHHTAEPIGVIAMCTDVFPDTPYASVYGIEADRRIRAAAFNEPGETRWRWWSGNVSTTAETFRVVGDYDEAFRTYGWEDVDWGYRLASAGIPVVIPPVFTTRHHGPVTSAAQRARRALHSGSAREVFVRKHGPGILPEPKGAATLWDRAVSLAAVGATEGSISAVGALLDRTVDRMPSWMAEKQVALLVQSSALAGRRYPHRARTHL